MLKKFQTSDKEILIKEIQKREKPFDFLRKLLIITGFIDLPFGPFKNVLTVTANCAQLFLLVVVVGAFIEATKFSEKMECILVFSCNFHVFTKTIILPMRRKLICEILERLEKMDEESSKEGELRKERDRNIFITKAVAYIIIGCFTFMHLGAAIIAISKYLNNNRTMPFQFYVPFEKYEHFYMTCLYVYAVSFCPIVLLATNQTLLTSLTLNISTQMSYLMKKLEKIGSDDMNENEDSYVNKCIRLHQQVLRVTEILVDLYADLLYLEYLMSLIQCCTAAYQFIVARNQHDPKETLYFFIFILTLFIPIFFSICGNQIKIQSEKIFEAVYNNYWYKMSTKNKRKFHVILSLSKRTLTISYKQLITFDMEQYSLMVKTAYSLIAVIQTMET